MSNNPFESNWPAPLPPNVDVGARTELIPPPPALPEDRRLGYMAREVARELISRIDVLERAIMSDSCRQSLSKEMAAVKEACAWLVQRADLSCTHNLKADPGPFEDMVEGRKTYEVRRFDRDFRVGDRLLLSEFDRAKRSYTGRQLSARIVHVLPPGYYGLPSDVGVLGLADIGPAR